MRRIIFMGILLTGCFSFSLIVSDFKEEKPVPIPPSKQRSGNAEAGYAYLTSGDYVKSGIPYELYKMAMGSMGVAKTDYLKRKGLNAGVSHEYTVVKAANGENVVAPNCMQCHAQVFDSTLYVGMGNTFIDFSRSQQQYNSGAFAMMGNMLKQSSPSRYEAAKPFLQSVGALAPFIITKTRGVNAADRLTAVLASHRDPVTFKWVEKAQFDLPDEVIPTDVPAWWLLKKKNAMFHNGFGRGDFGRFLMASNLLTVSDTSESREVDNHINDVLAYIYSLKAPKYPREVNAGLADEGHVLFEKNCSKCHGKYNGQPEEYPNLLVPESIIKTDSLLFKSNYQNPQLINWFNNSWFAKGDHPARLEPYNGYIAPPLDGVWVTAPYLHNGSVPTIEGVLNSKARPKYWGRNFDQPQYDYSNLGWQFQSLEQPGTSTTVYNTDVPGYGNYGHYFGDKLTGPERKAVIEYLKTL